MQEVPAPTCATPKAKEEASPSSSQQVGMCQTRVPRLYIYIYIYIELFIICIQPLNLCGLAFDTCPH